MYFEIITKEIFAENKTKYLSDIREIYESNSIKNEDIDSLFEKHPESMLVTLKNNQKIISFMFVARISANYIDPFYEDNGYWKLFTVATHKKYQNFNFAKGVLIFGFVEMLKQGATRIEVEITTYSGMLLFYKTVNPFTVGTITPKKDEDSDCWIINFKKSFCNFAESFDNKTEKSAKLKYFNEILLSRQIVFWVDFPNDEVIVTT